MQPENFQDTLFKGCTRPAMVWGVPLTPLVVAIAVVMLLAIWTSILIGLLLLPIVVVMRSITRSDDQQFRLLGLQLSFRGLDFPILRRLFHCNRNGRFWQASSYSPFQFKRRK